MVELRLLGGAHYPYPLPTIFTRHVGTYPGIPTQRNFYVGSTHNLTDHCYFWWVQNPGPRSKALLHITLSSTKPLSSSKTPQAHFLLHFLLLYLLHRWSGHQLRYVATQLSVENPERISVFSSLWYRSIRNPAHLVLFFPNCKNAPTQNAPTPT